MPIIYIGRMMRFPFLIIRLRILAAIVNIVVEIVLMDLTIGFMNCLNMNTVMVQGVITTTISSMNLLTLRCLLCLTFK